VLFCVSEKPRISLSAVFRSSCYELSIGYARSQSVAGQTWQVSPLACRTKWHATYHYDNAARRNSPETEDTGLEFPPRPTSIPLPADLSNGKRDCDRAVSEHQVAAQIITATRLFPLIILSKFWLVLLWVTSCFVMMSDVKLCRT